MRRAIRTARRPVRRFMLWSVGQPQLRLVLEEQQALITAQGFALAALQEQVKRSELNLSQGLEALLHSRDDGLLTARDFTLELTAQIDRLDGYLAYQGDSTRRAIAAGFEAAPHPTIPASKNLDAI